MLQWRAKDFPAAPEASEYKRFNREGGSSELTSVTLSDSLSIWKSP
jgi:hypothetical protein